MFEKFISMIMVPILFLQSLLPMMMGSRNDAYKKDEVAQLHSLQEYIDYVEEVGVPAFSTRVFVDSSKPLSDLLRAMTGRPFAQDDDAYLKVTMTDTLSEICDYIAANSGLDIELLITTLPNLNGPAELVGKVFKIDPTELREWFYKLRDEAYGRGDVLFGGLFFLLGAYYSIISEVNIYTVEHENFPGEYCVTLDVIYADGEKETMQPGIIIDAETGRTHGWTDKGMIDLGFDFDVKELVTYGAVNCWQRALGFSVLYDLLGNSAPIFNMTTRRFKFDYAGKQWMIQLWKGNYLLMSNGAELGVYNREPQLIGTFYNAASDDEMMPMTMTLSHNGEELFTKGPMLHWWMSAFKITTALYQPKDLTLVCTIEMPDDEMLEAFAASVDRHTAHDVTYVIDGRTITLTY